MLKLRRTSKTVEVGGRNESDDDDGRTAHEAAFRCSRSQVCTLLFVITVFAASVAFVPAPHGQHKVQVPHPDFLPIFDQLAAFQATQAQARSIAWAVTVSRDSPVRTRGQRGTPTNATSKI